MRLLPVGKKKKQKLVIGDDSGEVVCFEMKKGEAQPVFKTTVEGSGVNVLARRRALEARQGFRRVGAEYLRHQQERQADLQVDLVAHRNHPSHVRRGHLHMDRLRVHLQ